MASDCSTKQAGLPFFDCVRVAYGHRHACERAAATFLCAQAGIATPSRSAWYFYLLAAVEDGWCIPLIHEHLFMVT